MNFKIIAVGKFPNKSPYLEIFESYRKRIENKIELVEIKGEIKKNKLFFDKSMIEKYINPLRQIIILDNTGKNLSSKEFSDMIRLKMEGRYKEIVFVIGGPNGFDISLLESFFAISFGIQTWPHILVRVMLIEQIYRALQIISGHPYHK